MSDTAKPLPQAQAKFTQGNLFGHISVMSLTASVGLMAVFLVDFVDMIFISMLGKAELAAAVGYAGAVLFFTTSFGIAMAIAAGALAARALGAGEAEDAGRRATNAVLGPFQTGASNFHELTSVPIDGDKVAAWPGRLARMAVTQKIADRLALDAVSLEW